MTYSWPTEREHFGYALKHVAASGRVRIEPRLARVNVFVPSVAGFEVELPMARFVRLGWPFTLFNKGTVDLKLIRSATDFADPYGTILVLPPGQSAHVYIYGVNGNGDGLWLTKVSISTAGPIR